MSTEKHNHDDAATPNWYYERTTDGGGVVVGQLGEWQAVEEFEPGDENEAVDRVIGRLRKMAGETP